MPRHRVVTITFATALCASVAYAQSAQEKADAEALFNAARAALAAGNLAEACPKFAESQKKDPAIGTSLYLAECYEKSGKIASAWAEFRQAEDMAKQRKDNRAALAKARADRLQPSTMIVTLAPGADSIPGLEIKRDGIPLSSAQLRLSSPIDGGQHVVTASANGYKTFEWRGDVPEQKGAITVTVPKLESAPTPVASATSTVTAPPATATTSTPPPPPPPGGEDKGSGGSGMKIAGLVVAGAGVVAIGVGSGLGLAAKGDYDASNAAPYNCNTTSTACPTQAGVDLRNSAVTMANVATGLFIGGGVFIAGGLVMFFVAPRSKPASSSALRFVPLVSAGGGGAMLLGRF